MYSEADIPVLQMSMPDLNPEHLFEIGKRLAPLRDEGVLIIGSGFMTHGLPFIHEYFLGKPGAPQWSMDFDQWAMEALNRGDVDTLFAFREKAPGMPYAHPTVEHFAPLFVTLGAVAKPDEKPEYAIEGYAYGLPSARSRHGEAGRLVRGHHITAACDVFRPRPRRRSTCRGPIRAMKQKDELRPDGFRVHTRLNEPAAAKCHDRPGPRGDAPLERRRRLRTAPDTGSGSSLTPSSAQWATNVSSGHSGACFSTHWIGLDFIEKLYMTRTYGWSRPPHSPDPASRPHPTCRVNPRGSRLGIARSVSPRRLDVPRGPDHY